MIKLLIILLLCSLNCFSQGNEPDVDNTPDYGGLTGQKMILAKQIDSFFIKSGECIDSSIYFRKLHNEIRARFYDKEMDRWLDSVYVMYEKYFPEEFCDFMDHWGGIYTKKYRNFCLLFKQSGKKDPVLWNEQ